MVGFSFLFFFFFCCGSRKAYCCVLSNARQLLAVLAFFVPKNSIKSPLPRSLVARLCENVSPCGLVKSIEILFFCRASLADSLSQSSGFCLRASCLMTKTHCGKSRASQRGGLQPEPDHMTVMCVCLRRQILLRLLPYRP